MIVLAKTTHLDSTDEVADQNHTKTGVFGLLSYLNTDEQ